MRIEIVLCLLVASSFCSIKLAQTPARSLNHIDAHPPERNLGDKEVRMRHQLDNIESEIHQNELDIGEMNSLKRRIEELLEKVNTVNRNLAGKIDYASARINTLN